MKDWLIRISVFLLLGSSGLGGFTLFGQNLKKFNLDDKASVEYALLDFPAHYIPLLKAELPTTAPDRQPLRWMRIVWFLSQAKAEVTLDQLQKAIDIAWGQRQYTEWADLRFSLIKRGEEQNIPFEELVKQNEGVLAQARQQGDPELIAYCLAHNAEFLLDHNNVKRATEFITEANELVKQKRPESVRTLTYINDMFAMNLGSQERWEASHKVYAELEKTFRELGIRAARGENLYNMAWYFMEGDTPSPEAVQYLNHSLKLATEIQDIDTMAADFYGLSVYFMRSQEAEKAVDLARKALHYYTQLDDRLWMGYSALRLAQALVETKQHAAALEMIDQAEKRFPAENIESHLKLEELRASAYEGLRQFEKAFHHHKLYAEHYRNFTKEKEKKEYNRAAAQLGLQFEEERNKALEKEKLLLGRQNQLQQDQIQLLNKFRVVSLIAVVLTLLVCAVLVWVYTQSLVIQRSREIMKDVLDNIDEGLLIIDRHFRITSGYSPYLQKIFAPKGEELGQKPIMDLFFPAEKQLSEQAVMVKETLQACIGEPELSWELNRDHLPRDLEIDKRIYQIHWQALYDRQGIVHRFLIAMRDITEYRQLERAMALEKERVSALQQKLEEILSRDLGAIDSFLQEIQRQMSALQGLFQHGRIKEAFHTLHTWKGTARTLGMKRLASRVHALESGLDIKENRLKDAVVTEDLWEKFLAEVQDYQQLLTPIFRQKSTGLATPTDLYGFASLYAQELQSRLKDLQLPFAGLTVHDEILQWPKDYLLTIHEILVLGTTNALDHGFLLPLRKSRQLAPAHLAIQARYEGDRILLTLDDNGAGIDWDALKEKAHEVNFQPQPGENLTALLFQDGFSTASVVSETSGRGVGLSAIRALSEKLGGRVSLDDRATGGTRLALMLPANPSVSGGGTSAA